MSVSPASWTAPESKGRLAQSTSITGLLLRAARQRTRSGVLFVSGEREDETTLLTYPTLLDEARRILGGLRACNRPPGSKVVLLLERARDFIPAFWGCVLGGYVPCPMTPIRNDPERWAKHWSHI
jgi:acyl-CoA synthetase (AMP-forming)/AMP-acid ligase II